MIFRWEAVSKRLLGKDRRDWNDMVSFPQLNQSANLSERIQNRVCDVYMPIASLWGALTQNVVDFFPRDLDFPRLE